MGRSLADGKVAWEVSGGSSLAEGAGTAKLLVPVRCCPVSADIPSPTVSSNRRPAPTAPETHLLQFPLGSTGSRPVPADALGLFSLTSRLTRNHLGNRKPMSSLSGSSEDYDNTAALVVLSADGRHFFGVTLTD
jgi:hypothetical protein